MINFKNTNNIFIDANPASGFNFPFMLVIPNNTRINPDLIVACTLPHDYLINSNSYLEALSKTCEDFSSLDPMHKHLSLESQNPLFIPFIPKVISLKPGFLGKKLFYNDFTNYNEIIKYYKNSITLEDIYKYTDLSEQFCNMILYAINYLKSININVDNRVIISGYSEGAKFATHFSLLHPELIKFVVAGGTSGCISMPVTNIGEYTFSYPTGISDLKNFDMDSFKKINFFYYMGSIDKSDPAMPNFETVFYIDENGQKKILRDECGNETPSLDGDKKIKFKLDNNGNYRAKYTDCFDDSEVNSINKALGTNIQERFIKQQEIYKNLGLNCIFNIYPGNHLTVFDNKKQIFADVDSFITNNCDLVKRK